MIFKHNCSSIRKQQNFLYMSHSIISYLGSLNNEFYVPHSSILLNQKSIPGDMTIFASRCDKQHLSSRNWQHTECRESPKNVSHTKKLKSIFVLVMNWTENNLQISHFMLGLGRTYITINIIWILAKGQTAKFVQHATKLSEIHRRPPSYFFRKLWSFK